MSQKGTFRVLLVWLWGSEQYRDPDIGEELTEAQQEAFAAVASRRRHGFALVAFLNWRPVYKVRDIRLPRELAELWELPEDVAVDRLIGHDDGPRWVPGVAGLEPQEARVLRWRVLEYRPTADICRWARCTPHTVHDHLWTAKRKLRLYFRPADDVDSQPSRPVPAGHDCYAVG